MNPIKKIQQWMDSPSGQVFMNYAYSWGAAVVILGTLFKLTHIPGANLMLFIGMGTEVFVFFISGFEKTYEKVPSQENTPVVTGIPQVTISSTMNFIFSPEICMIKSTFFETKAAM